MSYREMAIDAGASGEDEIRQLAEMIEADHREDFERCQREQEVSEPKVYDEWEDDGNFYRVVQSTPREPLRLEVWAHEIADEQWSSVVEALDREDERGNWHETDAQPDLEAVLVRLASLAEQLQEATRG